MPTLKAVFLDNDGVLADTEALYYRATRETFARQGIVLDAETYRALFLRQGRGAWFLLAERGCPAAEIERLRQERNAAYAGLLRSEDVLIPGVGEALRRLARRLELGVVTSSRRDHFELIHQRTGLRPFFRFTLAGEDYERAKPDPEPYLKAIALSGRAATECLAVEDSERGLAAAAAAGLRCVAVPRGLSEGGDFSAAWRVCSDLAAAADEILRLC
jgi:HAD superfamily hydrolase (TIGR01509 family)